ncbi:HVA22-like protein i [Iris pallida]|nr:HVA22-like protein i [Iris pallida]
MIGSFLTRGLALVLGYAYPAYECFKTVELNKPEIEQLRFWCQYWILVAALTVFERVGDSFVSWIPMYGEAKLAFFVYLWYPKTRGTLYVYETFFRPYVAKHEMEIDRNLIELRTRAGDLLILYWQKAASYGQTRVFEILQYVASQSQAQPSRPRPPQQRQPPEQVPPSVPTAAAREPAVSQQAARPPPPPSSPTKNLRQEATKAGATSSVAPPADARMQTSVGRTSSSVPSSSETSTAATPTGPEAMHVGMGNAPADNDVVNTPPQEIPVEEAIRVTRGRLRKRAAIGGNISTK